MNKAGRLIPHFKSFIKLELSKQYGLGINIGTCYRIESRNILIYIDN